MFATVQPYCNRTIMPPVCLSADRPAGHLKQAGRELATAAKLTARGLPMRTVLLASSDQVSIRLTPLGRWAMREALLEEGAQAPAIAANEGDGPALLDLAGLSDDHASVEGVSAGGRLVRGRSGRMT